MLESGKHCDQLSAGMVGGAGAANGGCCQRISTLGHGLPLLPSLAEHQCVGSSVPWRAAVRILAYAYGRIPEPESRCRSIYVNPKGTPWSITSASKACVRISSESFSPVSVTCFGAVRLMPRLKRMRVFLPISLNRA
jgi:hypothetical protein